MMDLNSFKNKFNLNIQQGRFVIKTLSTPKELKAAFRLRYKVFQVELIGLEDSDQEDFDSFDFHADHLGIFDIKSGFLVATCRINHSDFCRKFYSEQEFYLKPLIENDLKKMELGRVCVHKDYRKGILIILLWRAIAKYIQISKADILFGCGSVASEDPNDAFLLYRYLLENKKIRHVSGIVPTQNYTSVHFQNKLSDLHMPLSELEVAKAKNILPPLCRSYFDIGCYVPSIPAFDKEFKCIDFLTVLQIVEIDPSIKKKLFGGSDEV